MTTRLTSPEIRATVLTALSRSLKRDVSNLPAGTRIDQLGMDSLSIIGLVGEMEEAFDVELDNAEIRGSDTIATIVQSIETRLARQ